MNGYHNGTRRNPKSMGVHNRRFTWSGNLAVKYSIEDHREGTRLAVHLPPISPQVVV